ncbi:unnamed protein product [Polarella glacialis]|uniref:NADP-dependent oxidoreductase domain-containing protein n=1 Tax=Polarella glacialis TaxID=89957 RepID=A0A813DY24_POLGL|nr:unnamed protein product [Polarella glacialis]
MGFCGKMCHLLFMRLLPILVVVVAAFIGWLGSQEVPEGTFFATLIPVLGGYLPPPITGPWTTPGTKEVPADLAPVPRPVGEILLKLPGGSQMPANGLGMCCRPTAYDPESVRRTVLWYLLLGGRHIDDADVYWNHGPVGEAIHEGVARGVPRSEIFVTTKLFPRFYGQNATVTAVHRFLKELGLDYLDLVLMHAPAHPLGAYGECVGKSYKECRQETWQALSSLRAQGLIREIGVSHFNADGGDPGAAGGAHCREPVPVQPLGARLVAGDLRLLPAARHRGDCLCFLGHVFPEGPDRDSRHAEGPGVDARQVGVAGAAALGAAEEGQRHPWHREPEAHEGEPRGLRLPVLRRRDGQHRCSPLRSLGQGFLLHTAGRQLERRAAAFELTLRGDLWFSPRAGLCIY